MAARDLPIYLHSSWRTGSTYLWSKFRARPDAYCYFEPLNEHLATATQAFVDGFAPWPYANHPALTAPYLEEFRPLLEAGGGMPGFPADLTFGRYRMDRTSECPALRTYFEGLAQEARRCGRRPVFGCVRTDLRIDWFRHHLAGVHIALQRDPRRQFVSFLNQAVKGNRYFLERGWVILGRNRDDPAFASLVAALEVPLFVGSRKAAEAFYAERAWTSDWSTLYTIAFALHRLAQDAIVAATVDLVIDLDGLHENPRAIAETEQSIEALTGLAIPLQDCCVERYDQHLAWSAPFFAAIEAKVEALLHDAGMAEG